jgi:hypothetical protein
MKKLKKVIDERQELEQLRIEHVLFWIVFWLLFVSIIVQLWFLRAPIAQVAAEWIVFMFCCISSAVASMRKGHWDNYSVPGPKSSLVYALIGSFVFSALFLLSRLVTENAMRGYPLVLAGITLILFVSLFALIFVVLLLSAGAVKKRRAKLEKEFSDEEE